MFKARNIVINKTERDIDGLEDHKAVDFSFTSDIYKCIDDNDDGEFHHSYNEPNLGIPNGISIEEHVSRIIKNHLQVWEASEQVSVSQSLPDIDTKIKEKSEEQIVLEDFQKVLVNLRQLEAGIKKATEYGIPLDPQIEADLEKAKQDLKDKFKPEFIKLLQ